MIEFKCSTMGLEEKTAVINTVAFDFISNTLINEEFEELFAKFIGVKHAISVNSGNMAIQLVLLAHKTKGEVIVSGFSSASVFNSIINAGLKPVFVDIDLSNYMINVKTIEAAITSKTKAVIVSHHGGNCAKISQIKEFCDRKKIILIEDCFQTIGANENGKMAGSFGVGCFSFDENSVIDIGGGGMITTNDSLLYGEIKKLVSNKADNKKPSWNCSMNSLLAALGIEKLKKVPKVNFKKQLIASFYNETLLKHVILQESSFNIENVYNYFPIVVPCKRDAFIYEMHRRGVEVVFPTESLHSIYCKKTCLPYTQWLVKHIVYLPIHIKLSEKQLYQISRSVIDASIYLFQSEKECSEYSHQVHF